MAAKFIDEINRLFEELVHSPWQPLGVPLPRPAAAPSGEWQAEVPFRVTERSDIMISTEGRQLTIAVRRRSTTRRSGQEADVTTMAAESYQQTFLLPEGSDMSSLELRFQDDRLRIRVGLKTPRA